MSFTEVIKRSKTIRRIGKSLKIYKEFLNDAHGFSSSYIEAAEEKENYKYSILHCPMPKSRHWQPAIPTSKKRWIWIFRSVS